MSKKIPILIGLLFVLLAVLVQVIPNYYFQSWVNALDTYSYDFQMRTKLFTPPKKFETSIAIVDIDDLTIREEGQWPWPRNKLAELISIVKEYGAIVIGLDMIFPEEEENIAVSIKEELIKKHLDNPSLMNLLKQLEPDFNYDTKLGKSLSSVDSVLGVAFTNFAVTQGTLAPPIFTLKNDTERSLSFITMKGYLSNIPILQQTAKTNGFINVFEDEDGIVRRAPLLIRYQDGLYPSLAFATILTFLFEPVQLVTASYGDHERLEGVKLGGAVIPTDAKGQVIVPFQGKSYTFPFFSAKDVLHRTIPKDSFLGKIIFIGTSATGLGDIKATSIGGSFPGVEIQATIADGLLKNNFIQKPDWALGAEIVFTVLVGLICALVFPYLGPGSTALLLILVPTFFLFVNTWVWQYTGLIISLLIPIFLTGLIALFNIVYGYLFESRRREQLKEMFGQYVPASHIDEMLTFKGRLGLQGEDRDMSVMFADIRNFTTISEELSASQLKELLNEFFTPMTEIIFQYDGTIDKYVGDLIMAFWGAPLRDEDHAQHAIYAALDMQRKLKDILKNISLENVPDIKIGIGINSGEMSVGDMGSKYRLNYTVLGDEVNLASRIENLSKFYGVDIITTENTANRIQNVVFKKLDRVRVKGKEKSVEIFEVIGKKGELTPKQEREVTQSNLALNHYFQQNFVEAEREFLTLNKQFPKRKVYKIFLERIEQYKMSPPPKDWNGVFVHREK